MKKEACKNCVFSFDTYVDPRSKKYGIVSCRRFPPMSSFEDVLFAYPRVSIDDWCGEFKPKPKQKGKRK